MPLAQQSEAASSNQDVQAAMADLYDHYFACHDYEKRYPQPNQSTLQFLLAQRVTTGTRILDFGCGNGRYALALLRTTPASLTGYDISEAALSEFAKHLVGSPFAGRARLVHGPHSVLLGSGQHDFVLLLFGVLSHVGDRAARVACLRQLRAVMAPNATLLLSVPSIWRRRPLELLLAAMARWAGAAQGAQLEPGNILFTRKLGGVPHQFFYHLYSVGRLKQELAEAGFEMTQIEAESLLPEWLVTQYPRIGKADAWLARLMPAAWGYGIRAVALPV
jgi:SAM-dependent methyltransferase